VSIAKKNPATNPTASSLTALAELSPQSSSVKPTSLLLVVYAYLQREVVDSIELSSSGFKTGIKVAFRNNRVARVMPEHFTRLGISSGTHSVMLFHDRKVDLPESIRWLATLADGTQKEIEVAERKELGKVTVFVLELQPNTTKIEVLLKSELLATIRVDEK
jgi:hypothetical protein